MRVSRAASLLLMLCTCHLASSTRRVRLHDANAIADSEFRADPWFDFARFEKRARDSVRKGLDRKNNGLAFLYTTGAMNPVHKGHIQMFRQARERLEREGYTVVGGWMAPAPDSYVIPKAEEKETFGLSATFRMEVVKVATKHDGFVDVTGRGAFGEENSRGAVGKSLQEELGKLSESLRGKLRASGYVSVFYVCGTDHAEVSGLYQRGLFPDRDVGAVVVPREGETPEAENPKKLLYVAREARGALAGMSSTKLREAMSSNDKLFVTEAMGKDAARFLLEPSVTEFRRFPDEYKKMNVSQRTGKQRGRGEKQRQTGKRTSVGRRTGKNFKQNASCTATDVSLTLNGVSQSYSLPVTPVGEKKYKSCIPRQAKFGTIVFECRRSAEDVVGTWAYVSNKCPAPDVKTCQAGSTTATKKGISEKYSLPAGTLGEHSRQKCAFGGMRHGQVLFQCQGVSWEYVSDTCT